MVAKDIFSFATTTDGCKEANFKGFSQYIYKNELTSENMYLPMILANMSPFHFSFFKVDSQNPKFSLEYLQCTKFPSYKVTKLQNYKVTKLQSFHVSKLPSYKELQHKFHREGPRGSSQ